MTASQNVQSVESSDYADCTSAACGWTGFLTETVKNADCHRCPDCGAEVRVFDEAAPNGRSEFYAGR